MKILRIFEPVTMSKVTGYSIYFINMMNSYKQGLIEVIGNCFELLTNCVIKIKWLFIVFTCVKKMGLQRTLASSQKLSLAASNVPTEIKSYFHVTPR